MQRRFARTSDIGRRYSADGRKEVQHLCVTRFEIETDKDFLP
jgi:hypothetical protein